VKVDPVYLCQIWKVLAQGEKEAKTAEQQSGAGAAAAIAVSK